MFKVNRNNRAMCEICSKLTVKTPERRQVNPNRTLRFTSRKIVDFTHALIILSKTFPIVSISYPIICIFHDLVIPCY